MSEETKRYVTCFRCKRDFELNEDKKIGKMWGICPFCKTEYQIKLKASN